MSFPMIAEAKDGWTPSVAVVNYLKRMARKRGLFSEWPTIAVLENHDLLLDCSPLTGDFGAELIAKKRGRRWEFEVG